MAAVAPPSSQQVPLPAGLPFRIISKTIGQGAYASVRKAIPLNAPRPVIAIKFINKEHAFRYGRLTSKQVKMEFMLHHHLGKHNNIIECWQSGEDAVWTWIAMEWAEGGDLFDKIEADEGCPEDVSHFYFTQLISAMTFMHSKGIAHRDLKPENILLGANGDLKLADFGLAALFKRDGKARMCTTICGSPPYIAPEVVNGRRSQRVDLLDEGYMANISDVWSSGIVLFVLLCGNTPWDEPSKRSLEYQDYVDNSGHSTDELWEKIPSDALSLIRGMLKIDPAKRFTLDEVRTHPWFTRKNAFLSSSGRNANPIGLATQMLSRLHIDFSQNPSQSQRSHSPDPDAMDIDTLPRRSSAGNHAPNLGVSSTQPETPITESPFDWERPPRLAGYDGISASQPADLRNTSLEQDRPSSTYMSQLPSSTQDLLSQDPSLTQFGSNPSVPLSLTQYARKFVDILPSYSLARFLSPSSLTLLIPTLVEALHSLGVPVANISEDQMRQWERDGEASLRVKMADGRRQGLNGHVVIERIVVDSQRICEVRFVKASGDPLEWRRFFKSVVVSCKDVILRPN
ncbi:serine/threonine-protein kinase-like protein chk1 [Amniculicola lignicola CBS 123094]|uniref:non-specific serine/threonine protein kinase n=1 Tax=Amniculicola lignicola CBS 123094 TaxID=1392246 RepID=A0A6A5WT12_9PLEO|nr:serine/threonine-protein kinase-like protein chk1 [Amniculicola lignicola CBS 123094]